MRFPPLVCGRMVKRYKRFLVDVDLFGEIVTAHCPNSGSMRNCIEEGGRVWLSKSDSPRRKLAYTLEMHEVNGVRILLNTQRPNAIIAEGLSQGGFEPLAMYRDLRREVPYGDHSRVDVLLSGDGLPDCYVEIKSATMGVGDGVTRFPDAVTERGTKHLMELARRAEAGDRAVLLFAASREDSRVVALAQSIDPRYAEALIEARSRGVEVYAVLIELSETEARMGQAIPFSADL